MSYLSDKELDRKVSKVLKVINGLTAMQNVTVLASSMLNVINELQKQMNVPAEETYKLFKDGIEEMFNSHFKGIPSKNVRNPKGEIKIEA
jgi:hypothetical protein